MTNGNLIRMFDAHYKAVRIIKFSVDDVSFLSGGEDGSVHLWLTAK
jgi:WD40 repeat protein